MKVKNTLFIAAISSFAIALLVCLYLNALSHRYSVLSGSDQLIMDNWTKKSYLLPEPKQLSWNDPWDKDRVVSTPIGKRQLNVDVALKQTANYKQKQNTGH